MRIRKLSGAVAITALIGMTSVTHTRAEDPKKADISYPIVPGDNLYIIAAQYYGDPRAFGEIFKRNKAVLEEAHKRNESGKTERKSQFDSGKIYPDTIIVLPFELKTKEGLMYERRAAPLRRDIAKRLADNKQVDLPVLVEITTKTTPPGVKRAAVPTPLDGFTAAGKGARQTNAQREATPAWYTHPTSPLQKCAKDVCDKHLSLCYFECLAVAKRLSDGGVSCTPLSQTLPYDFDASIGSECSALME